MVVDTLTAVAVFVFGAGIVAAILFYMGWDKHG